MIGSMSILEGQALLKYQSLVDTCLEMGLELELEVSPLSWKDTLRYCLQTP